MEEKPKRLAIDTNEIYEFISASYDKLIDERIDKCVGWQRALDYLKDWVGTKIKLGAVIRYDASSGLLPCPFCGENVYLEKVSLDEGNGHGYPGDYEFDIHCKNCGCRVNLGGNDTIYNSEEEAIINATSAWNRRAEKSWKYTS